MPIENRLTAEQCNVIGWRIVARFDRAAVGDPYGWDWPTMNVLFPNKVAVFKRLRKRWLACAGSFGPETVSI